MTTIFTTINTASNALCAPWFNLLQPLPTFVQMILTAIPVTLFALLVFRFASDQAGITAAKDQIKAHLLELWLYRDYPAVLLRAQGQVLLNSFTWLGYSLVPLAIMLAPIALLLVQIESRFAARPLAPGESVIVTVTLAPAPGAGTDTALDLPAGLRQDTPALHRQAPARLLWRIRATAPGEPLLAVRTPATGVPAVAPVVVGTGQSQSQAPALAPALYRANDWRSLGSPATAPLDPAAGVAAIEIGYPPASGPFTGLFLGLSAASWALFGAALVLGFGFRGWFGVTF